jgi:SM-20-related protein
MRVPETRDFDLHLARDFFDAEICEALTAELRMSPANPAVTYKKGRVGSVDERVRKVARLIPAPGTVELVQQRLSLYRETLIRHFGIKLERFEEPQFLRYRVGDFFVVHQDGNTGLINLESDKFRRVSVSIFLNAQSDAPKPDHYCGGSLIFSDWRGGHSCLIRGEVGTLVAFPSELAHEVTPVTCGERFAIVTWYGSD